FACLQRGGQHAGSMAPAQEQRAQSELRVRAEQHQASGTEARLDRGSGTAVDAALQRRVAAVLLPLPEVVARDEEPLGGCERWGGGDGPGERGRLLADGRGRGRGSSVLSDREQRSVVVHQ